MGSPESHPESSIPACSPTFEGIHHLRRLENLSFFCWEVSVFIRWRSSMDSSSISSCFRSCLIASAPIRAVNSQGTSSIICRYFSSPRTSFSSEGSRRHPEPRKLEIKDTLQISQAQVQQDADPTRQPLKETRHGSRDLPTRCGRDAPAEPGQRDLNPALVANHSPVFHPFVLPAKTFPISDGAEDFGAEQTVPLRFEGSVVDGLSLVTSPLDHDRIVSGEARLIRILSKSR